MRPCENRAAKELAYGGEARLLLIYDCLGTVSGQTRATEPPAEHGEQCEGQKSLKARGLKSGLLHCCETS